VPQRVRARVLVRPRAGGRCRSSSSPGHGVCMPGCATGCNAFVLFRLARQAVRCDRSFTSADGCRTERDPTMRYGVVRYSNTAERAFQPLSSATSRDRRPCASRPCLATTSLRRPSTSSTRCCQSKSRAARPRRRARMHGKSRGVRRRGSPPARESFLDAVIVDWSRAPHIRSGYSVPTVDTDGLRELLLGGCAPPSRQGRG
jgi:hypothetical protein